MCLCICLYVCMCVKMIYYLHFLRNQRSKYHLHGLLQSEIYLCEIEDKLININESGKSYPNLPTDKREALKSLMNDNEIIIKPADKGSAVVI